VIAATWQQQQQVAPPYAQTPSNKYSSKKSRLAAARAASLCDPYACFLAGLKVITAE